MACVSRFWFSGNPLELPSASESSFVIPPSPLFILPLKLQEQAHSCSNIPNTDPAYPYLITAWIPSAEGCWWSPHGPNTSPLPIFKKIATETRLCSQQCTSVGYLLFTLPNLRLPSGLQPWRLHAVIGPSLLPSGWA